MLVLNLFLKANFVSMETYKADREAYRVDKEKSDKVLNEMSSLLTRMEERDKVNDRQDETLKDHEKRMREVERFLH